MARKEIFLEEAVLDDLSQGLDVVERPFSGAVFRLFAFVAVGVALVIAGRVLYLSFLQGGLYKDRALANTGRQVVLMAPRGIIYDSADNALVSNEPSFGLVLNLSELFRDRSSIRATLETLSAIVPFSKENLYDDLMRVDLEHQSYYVVSRSVSLSQVVALRQLDNRAVVVEENFSRLYADGSIFSHIVGYTGAVSPADLEENSSLYARDDIGRSGIEASYDSFLRGTHGVALSLQDAFGNTLDTKVSRDPQAGDDVYTTIDSDLQKFVYGALEKQLSQLGRRAGVALVINPQTEPILSLVSAPSFDNTNIDMAALSDSAKPLFNRAVSGLYSPGSTIKPLVAFGALEEGIVSPLRSILSIGYIEIANPYDPSNPSRFVDWRPQGWVNMYSALARSSNVYFYEIGGGFPAQGGFPTDGGGYQEGLGIDRLKQYWQTFLLDQKTGVDLPGEQSGFLPDPQSKEDRRNDIWRLGDTYNVSIGQGDLVITPLELLRYIGGIAMHGTMAVPHVVDRVVSQGGAEEYAFNEPGYVIPAKNAQDFDEVERGMLDAVRKDYGTAHSLADIPMVIAAKTGSAQIQNNQKTNAFFVGYGPVPNPQIAVLVLVEDAKEGSLNAVPVGKEIFQWWYEHRIVTSG